MTKIYKTVNGRDVPLLFFPPTANVGEKAPLLVLIPGGGWNLSDAQSMYDMERAACEILRDKGFAVAALSYRNHHADGVNMREMVADVFDGLTYLLQNAEELRIDRERIYTSGHSAGAHLSLMLAYAPAGILAAERVYPAEEYTVRATAPLSPPTFLPQGDPAPYLAFAVDELFERCTPDEYRAYSPECLLESGHPVPSLIAVGSADNLVFPQNGERLAEMLRARGVRSELIVSQNGGHGFEPVDTDRSAPDLPEILERLAAFFLEENAK